jgi:hypothetical protein
MLSIHVPTSEIIWPLKKSWKLRWFKARNICGTRRVCEEFLFAPFWFFPGFAISLNCTTPRGRAGFDYVGRCAEDFGGEELEPGTPEEDGLAGASKRLQARRIRR